MTSPEAAGQALISSRLFTDAEELAHAIRDVGIDYIPLDPGRYDARLTLVQAGSLHIQRGADRAHVARGVIDPGRVGLLFCVRQAAAATINGYRLRDADVLALLPGRELHALCPAPVDWASLSLPLAETEMLLELGGLPSLQTHAEPMLLIPPEPATLARRAVVEITDLVQRRLGTAETARLADVLPDGLLELCMEAFSRAEQPPARSRATRDATRILAAAEEFLRARIDRPIYTGELCKALAVSPRKLHHAFAAACGMSPHAYLKRRRLMLVHHCLRAGGPEAPLVKSVALAHGFWHLGNFARDYREQFGQSPSETFAQGGIGAAAR